MLGVPTGKCEIISSCLKPWNTPLLLCKIKRQYLLTCEVSRYCLLALYGSIIQLVNRVDHYWKNSFLIDK